jgi:hypothetical protein
MQESTLSKDLIEVTVQALKSVTKTRFFTSERGYQGELYCSLKSFLDSAGLFEKGYILEMEYQKKGKVHQTTQRPDIILHVPREETDGNPRANNLAVWALKRNSNPRKAAQDIVKLNEMIEGLKYKVGFFINIDSEQVRFNDSCVRDLCHQEMIFCFAVKLKTDSLVINSYNWNIDQRKYLISN